MNRRLLLSTSALALPALAGCAAIQNLTNGAGTAAGQAAVAKLVSYVQAAVTGLTTLLTTFGSAMSASARTTAQDALNALNAVATSIGNAVSSGAAASSAASTAQNVGTLIQTAANAIILGLQAVPGLGPAVAVGIGIAQEVVAFIPTITQFIASLTNPSGPTVSASMFNPAPALAVMVR